MHWLYHPTPPVHAIIVPDEEEQRHIRALRLRDGDDVIVTDGRGTMHTCKVATQKKYTELIVVSSSTLEENPYKLTLAIAPTKNADRIEWLIEKAVEIGIKEIRIVKTEHAERTHLKLERLQRVAIAAIKQSRKVFLPHLTEAQDFDELLQAQEDVRCIAHCADDLDKKALQHIAMKGKNTLIAIGPEGDFSKEEIQKAKAAGFHAISLGEERLRTETAGLMAVAYYAYQNY